MAIKRKGSGRRGRTQTHEVLLGRRDIRARIKVSPMTIWRWTKKGDFPEPRRKIGGRNYWAESDDDAVISPPPGGGGKPES